MVGLAAALAAVYRARLVEALRDVALTGSTNRSTPPMTRTYFLFFGTAVAINAGILVALT